MKLELKHISPYFPYRLKAEILDYKCDYVGNQYDEIVGLHQWDKDCLYWSALTVGGSSPDIERIKPILRPLSDLTKEIEHDGESFIPADIIFPIEDYETNFKRKVAIEALMLANAIGHSCTPFIIVQKLFEWHFDLFNLIDDGLAIDINTLNNLKNTIS